MTVHELMGQAEYWKWYEVYTDNGVYEVQLNLPTMQGQARVYELNDKEPQAREQAVQYAIEKAATGEQVLIKVRNEYIAVTADVLETVR